MILDIQLDQDVRVLTDVNVADTGEPQRDTIVVFSSPADGTHLTKRIVAVPGDVIEMKN